jgi:hypothetical protein
MNKIFFLILFCSFQSQLAFTQCQSGDCKNGKGIFLYPSGAKYIGDFKNGECHGIGTCYYTDQSKYQGEWKNRYPEGKGTKTYADGTKRTGLWKKGKPVDENGQISEDYIAKKKEERQDDGTNIQSGCLTGDCQGGQGVFAYPDGSKYEGQFMKSKFDGWGTFYFANGDKYIGTFKENYPQGNGTRYHADGTQESGEWREGEFIGASMIESGRYGCIEGDCANGKGTYVYKEGSAKYIGQFKNDLPSGAGTCTYANGDRYRGNWSEGAFEGKGTLYMHDGREVVGYWKAGEFVGKTNPEDEKPMATATPAQQAAAEQAVDKAQETKVWAVVVGVSSYNHMPALRYTDDDAYRFYAFLKSMEGGALPDNQVRVLIDEEATRDNILQNIDEVFEQASERDLVIFYFSGHGLNGSFLPIDFDGYNNKILHEEIADAFNKCRAKFKLCLADACHSGSIIAMRGDTDPILSQYYNQLSKSVSGTALIMSSKSDETSLESQGLRQGVFSHFLIRGLKGEADKDKNSVVTVKEIYDYIYESVTAYTGNRQSPVIKGTYDPMMPVAVGRN